MKPRLKHLLYQRGPRTATNLIKVKVKLSLCLINKAPRMEEWRYSYTILDLGTGWRLVVSFTLLPLSPRGNRPRYPLNRRLGGPQSRSGSYEEKKIFPLLGIEPVARCYTDWAILALNEFGTSGLGYRAYNVVGMLSRTAKDLERDGCGLFYSRLETTQDI
jgi:hypothetical protein